MNLVDGIAYGVAVRANLPRFESAHSNHMRAKVAQTIELYGTLWTEIHAGERLAKPRVGIFRRSMVPRAPVCRPSTRT